jgi:hypothetical protein
MSNPSGTGSDDPPEVDTDPVTEVIEIPADTVPPVAVNDERRYTAPGFDAGSTQIIDRVPDDETEFIATPTQAFGAGRRMRKAGPQAIAPRGRQRPSWMIPILLVVAALAAAAILGLILLKRSQAAAEARLNAVRSTIETFDAAVRKGDLTTLREITCGQTRETYLEYDDSEWSQTYQRVSAAQQYPVVASIDEVVIDGDHAEANVTSYMAFDPSTTSTRSFDLQRRDDQWKICQSS